MNFILNNSKEKNHDYMDVLKDCLIENSIKEIMHHIRLIVDEDPQKAEEFRKRCFHIIDHDKDSYMNLARKNTRVKNKNTLKLIDRGKK